MASSSLAALQTHNEPTFNTADSTYYKPFYTQFLVDKYGTIENLNKVYKSAYKNFEEIEMPQSKETSMYFFDWQVFNESVLTDYFRIVAEEMAVLAPDLPYSAKYMAETSPTIADNTLKWGIDFEKVAPQIKGIAGNDAFAYLGNGTIQTKLAWYDLQHSVNGTAVADWEVEMSKEQLATRLIAMDSMVDSQAIRTGQLVDSDWDKLMDSTFRVGSTPMFIDDTPGITIAELRSIHFTD